MRQNTIPKRVKQKAESMGFNSISYSGHIDGADAYAVGIIGEDGVAVPVGLPTFILSKDGNISVVDGSEGLDLMLRL